MARKVSRAKSFSYDLLADLRPYASPPVSGWIYQGTVTLNGLTGALAWRRGCNGIAIGEHGVRDLGMWERIRIDGEVRFREVTGWETAPVFEGLPPQAVDPATAWAKAPPGMRPKP